MHIPSRRIITLSGKRKALVKERQHRMTEERIANRAAFYRALSTADKNNYKYTDKDIDDLYSAFAPFKRGDKVKHILDLNGYTYTVVGISLKPSTVLIGCKVNHRKALWFPSNLLQKADKT